jgi:hypothetical protein
MSPFLVGLSPFFGTQILLVFLLFFYLILM